MNVLYGRDALTEIGQLEEPVDLLVTDPPYAFGGDGEEHELSATVAVVLRESAMRLRSGRWAIIFCASSWRAMQYMVDAVRGVLIPVRAGRWVKPVARSKVRTPGWAWASVEVMVFRKGKAQVGTPSTLVDWIEAAPVVHGRRAELPAAVARWAVQPYVVRGGLAFDPFAGKGTLLTAAEGFGMRTLGYEIQAA